MQALGRALVRFVHAVPGAGGAHLELTRGGRTADLGLATFAHATAYVTVGSGRFGWRLVGGGKVLAKGTTTIGVGSYTIVVLAKAPGVALGIYRDRGGEKGTSLLRVIHAAPELGSPNLALDHHVVATNVGFTQATPYASVKPGTHVLDAMKAGDATPLVAGSVKLIADTATTVIVVGSQGQRTRVIALSDRGGPVQPAATRRRNPGAAPANTRNSHTAITVSVVIVRRGDSLWSIARAELGGDAPNARVAGEVRRIWDLNAIRIGTGDPNLIFPGQRLRLR